MATWQFEYMIIPKGRRKEDYLEEQLISWKGIEISGDTIEKISKLLPQEKSWTEDIEQYGSIDSTCIEILYEDKHVEEISGKFDLRDLSKTILIQIVEFINIIKGNILYKHNIYEVKLDRMVELLKNSPAAKFCRNPKDYLMILDSILEE